MKTDSRESDGRHLGIASRSTGRKGKKGLLCCLTGIALFAIIFASPATAQVSSTDLSYYPLHIGNIWVYQVSEFFPSHPQWRPSGYARTEIVGDSLLPNGKRYMRFSSGALIRLDSTSGIVYEYIRYGYLRSTCPDSTENEIFNLTIDTTAGYSRCNDRSTGYHDTCRIIPLSSEKVALLSTMRPQRIWFTSDFLGTEYKLAQGIGACVMSGAMFSGKKYELTYAKINGTEYLPVELRSFAATLLEGCVVRLQWETANEVQNRGFTVQRSEHAREAVWIDLAFIPSNAEEGRGGSYEYIDRAAKTDQATSAVRYRLRQQDYDGAVSYSPVEEVQFSPPTGPPDLDLYPNPVASGEQVNAQLGGALRDDVTRELQVFDALGRRVMSRAFDRTATLNTAGLPAGLYFVHVRGEPQAAPQRLVIF